MDYEISPRYAAGLRKNFFDTQRKSSKKIENQIKTLLSYSDFKFKDLRTLFAYYHRTINQIASISLFKLQGHETEIHGSLENPVYVEIEGSTCILLCIATPKSKQLLNATSEEYTEDYIRLEYYEVSVNPKKGMTFHAQKNPEYCEISSHTIERILQRRKSTKIPNIIEEITSSGIPTQQLFRALHTLPIKRWPFRIVIPSRSGAFLAEIDSSAPSILFRTFVKDEMFDFQESSVNATRVWLKDRSTTIYVTENQANELFNHKANHWWFDASKEQHLSYRNVVSVS